MIRQTLDSIKKLRLKFRYGLIPYFLLSRLKIFGLEIFPYYWVQEGIQEGKSLAFNKRIAECSFEVVGEKDMKHISTIPGREWCPLEKLLDRLKKGNVCVAAKIGNEIAAFTWCDFSGDSIVERKITLQQNEAYLFDMYTMKHFRGYDIAPHLRYECYKILRGMGRNVFYSVSDFYNSPSIKFKKKLGASFLELYLDIKLFKKFHWNWKIKDYPHEQNNPGIKNNLTL